MLSLNETIIQRCFGPQKGPSFLVKLYVYTHLRAEEVLAYNIQQAARDCVYTTQIPFIALRSSYTFLS